MIDRIKQVLEYSQLSTTAFADTIGISRSGLTHLLTGRNQPSLDVAKKILVQYPEISTEWLIMGMGDMFRTDNQEVVSENASSEVVDGEQHPSENQKLMLQADLFNEYENLDDSEEDVLDPRHPQVSVTETPVNASEEILVSQPLPAPNPVQAQNQGSRVRAKNTTTPNRRDKSVGNVTNQERKLQKIVFFFDDHSFEVYHNE